MTFAARTQGYSANALLIYDGTITQGYIANGAGPTPFSQYYGYASAALIGGTAIGSRSPTTLIDGKTLIGAYDEVYFDGTFANYYGRIVISGFSSDPLSTYLTYAVRGAVTTQYPPTYNYVSGTGTAYWYTYAAMNSSVLYGFSTSGTTSFKIYR